MGSTTKDSVATHQLRTAADWPLWSTRLSSRLAVKDCTKAIPYFPGDKIEDTNGEPTIIKSIAAATATVSAPTKSKAYGYLIESIHNDLLPLVDGLRDPGTIVDKLYEHFFGSSGTALAITFSEFHNCKMRDNETPDLYAARLDLLIKQITQAGGTINDFEAATQFRAGLPATQAWAFLLAQCDSLAAVQKKPLTYQELKDSAQLYKDTAKRLNQPNAALAIIPPPPPTKYTNKKDRFNRPNSNTWQRPAFNNNNNRPRPPFGNPRPSNNSNRPQQQPARQPPSPCKHCNGNHWNSDCPRRNSNNANHSQGPRHRVFLATSSPPPEPEFILDSGNGGHHIVNDPGLLQSPQPADTHIVTASGERLPVTAQGPLNTIFPGNAVLVPSATDNILSIKELGKHGWHVNFSDDQASIFTPEGRTYHVTATDLYRIQPSVCLVATPAEQGAAAMLRFHVTFGHLRSVPRLRAAAANANVDTSLWPKELPPCTACNKTNINRARVSHAPATVDTSLQPGQRLHCDLAFADNGHPILDVVDERSRYEMAAYPAYKSDAAAAMAQLIDSNYSSNQFDPKEVHTDYGGEFTGTDWLDMCKERHIQRSYSAPNTPQHNGLAERTHSISINMARAMLASAGLDSDKFWKAAHQHAILVRNLTPMPVLGNKCPYEIWHGVMPREFPVLLPFGTRVFYHTKDRAKFGQRTAEGLYMGPALGVVGGAIKVYALETRKIIITRSFRVEQLPSATPALPAADSSTSTNTTSSSPPDMIDSDSEDEGFVDAATPAQNSNTTRGNGNNIISSGPSTPPATPRTLMRQAAAADHASDAAPANAEVRDLRNITAAGFDQLPTGRLRSSSRRQAQPEGESQHSVLLSTTGEPNTFKAAMNSPNAAEWFAAAQKELTHHYVDAKTFDIIPREPGMREVLSKWVFKEKKDLNNITLSYKGRLVACGYSQVFGVDYFDSSAPVAARDSLRMVLALAASEGLCIVQADFANAYVNAPIDVTIYMRPPQGIVETIGNLLQQHELDLLQSGEATLRLNKALYGLKQSGLLWYQTLRDNLIAIGLQPTVSDPCVFINRDLGIIVIIYVDDLLVFARSRATADDIITQLQRNYNLKIIGTPSEFIGLGICQRPDGSIFIHQQGYSEQLCSKFSDGIHAKATPMTAGADIDGTGPPGDQQAYMEIIGSLLYAAVNTRPDIACATSILSRAMQSPTKAHVRAARTVASYLGNTADLGILYPATPGISLEAYCDASHAPSENKRRSRSGIVIFANGAPIIWSSALQPLTASSTSEAEYIAISDGARELNHAIAFFRELGVDIITPVPMHEDNQTTKRIAEEVTTRRSKYIDVRYHQIRDFIDREIITINYCPTADMIADLLTKPLPRDSFVKHRARLMVKGE